MCTGNQIIQQRQPSVSLHNLGIWLIQHLSSTKTMVEGICGKILAYSNSGIRSINRILSQMIMISEMSGPKLYTAAFAQPSKGCTKNQLIFHVKNLIIQVFISEGKFKCHSIHGPLHSGFPVKIFWNSAKRNLGVIYFILLIGS